MNETVTRVLDPFFIHPRGWQGRIGGTMMHHKHAAQERWALRRPEAAPGAHVLVIGFGTGRGLALAAAAVAPGGQVTGVEPSAVMSQTASRRCAAQVAAGVVLIREGSAEHTGCADSSVDLATSVNNVMMWDPAAGFAEVYRVLRPGGCLVVTAHRNLLLGRTVEQFVAAAETAGFDDVRIVSGTRGPVEIIAYRS